MSGRAPARLERTATVHPAAEAAGAFVAGAALFLLAGAASPIRHTLVLVLALGAVYVYVVVLAAKRLGPAYGVTLAIAAGTAFDSFFIPPTREFGSAEWQNWIVIAIYIAAGVLVGMIAARSRRSAELSAHTRDLLLEEQGALRRVATLVAQQTASSDVLAAVARELGQLLAVDATYVVRYHSDETARSVARWTRGADRIPTDATITLEGDSVITRVARTRRPARMDSYAGARGGPAAMGQELGVQAAVGAPIIVEADLWGAMIAASNEEAALPADTEDRLMAFSELVATAIANTEAQGEVRRLAEEQAALRRVATLVARGVPRERLFEAVVEELERLMPADVVAMAQYESDDTITTLATGGDVPAGFGSGVRWPVGGKNVTTLVAQTGRAARLDTYADAADKLDSAIREQGIRTSVGTPIMVEGKLWGVMHAASMHEQPLPADTEARLASFTELVATAIANTEARAQVRRLLDEQAGLRRVATLVARGVPATELFPLVVEEVGTLLGTALAGLVRFGGDGTLRPVAAWSADGEHPSLPERWPIEDGDAAALIVHARRPVRIDDWNEVHGPIASFIREIGISCSAASPILVEGRLWGALAVHMTGRDSLAADTELRLENFTELVATAISNAEARVAVQRLADEQAALRRVAMLVARESPREDVFEAVASEVAGLLDVDNTLLLRYENDGTATDMGGVGAARAPFGGSGHRITLDGQNVAGIVRRTGAPARFDGYAHATGPIATAVRKADVRSAVGCPIVVGAGLWGCLVAAAAHAESMPPDAEERLAQFAELVGTSIANVQAREELAASRARIVTATDDERRRVVRDLHDGAQQRLVHTVVTLKLALRGLAENEATAPALVEEALAHAETTMVELRELAHGILPSVLSVGGLRAGVEALATRMPLPVEIGVGSDRFPTAVEATAYFVVAEALTNVAKHANAAHAAVTADVDEGKLRIEISDDGAGTADPNGNGLLGLADRLASREGGLQIRSCPGEGTRVIATVPLQD